MIGVKVSVIGVRVAGGTTSSVTVRHLVARLDADGVDLVAWWAAAGLDRDALASPELRLPLPAFDALWARAVAHDPATGLRLIERFPPGQMHLVSHLALRAPTVGEALRAVERYMAVTDPLDRVELTRDAGLATLRYRNAGLEAGTRQNPGFVEHLMAMGVVLLERAAGRPLPLREVRLAAAPLAAPAEYLARFGLAPRFHATDNALVFDAVALDWPLATRDDYLRTLLEGVARDRLPAAVAADTPLAARVAERLRRGWLDGQPLDLAGTAGALGLSTAQLRARLAAEGSGFRALHDATRRDVARIHLAGPLSLGEIAWLLGFSEPAAFQHAVRRWFGASAGEVRARLAAGAPPQGEASTSR